MTNQSFWGINLSRDPTLRAADADRERVAERLRKSHAEGRLDTAELQQRLERCYEAKTVGELDELITDLPRETGPDEQPSPRWLGPWRWRLTPLVAILTALIVVCAVTGHHVFWPLIVIAFLAFKMSWWRWRPSRTVGGRGPREWV
jgi:hypothetical protein